MISFMAALYHLPGVHANAMRSGRMKQLLDGPRGAQADHRLELLKACQFFSFHLGHVKTVISPLNPTGAPAKC